VVAPGLRCTPPPHTSAIRAGGTNAVQRRKSCESDTRGFGWEMAHAAVSRRPPIPLYTIVARTHTYTYAMRKVWDLSIVRGALSVGPVPQPSRCDSQFFSSAGAQVGRRA
jgi:hypothetical protein